MYFPLVSCSRTGTHLTDTLQLVRFHTPYCRVPFDAVLFGVDFVCNDFTVCFHGFWTNSECEEFEDLGHLCDRRHGSRNRLKSISLTKLAQVNNSSKMEVGNLFLSSLFYVGNSCDDNLLVRF